MFNFRKQKKQVLPARELGKEVQALRERLAKTEKELDLLKKSHEKAVTKVGIIRFNPFREIGGDQSFSIALLDNKDNGFVLTSHYGKDMQRVYAKPVKQGKSEYQLSEEEQQAVAQAMDQKQ